MTVTDTEILDYLEHDYAKNGGGWHDVQFGRVCITLGPIRPVLRELLVKAIEVDKQLIIDDVTKRLVGPVPPTVGVDLGEALDITSVVYARHPGA